MPSQLLRFSKYEDIQGLYIRGKGFIITNLVDSRRKLIEIIKIG